MADPNETPLLPEVPEVNSTAGEIHSNLKEAIAFVNAAGLYLEKYPKERSKLTFVLRKQAEKLESKRTELGRQLNAEVESAEIKYASVYAEGENKGNLIERKFDFKTGSKDNAESTQARYAYTPEKSLELKKKIRDLNALYETKPITISAPFKEKPYFLEIPDDFDFRFFVAFKPFVFGEISEADELRVYLAQKEKEEPRNGTIKPVLTKQD